MVKQGQPGFMVVSGIILIGASAVLYMTHYLVFHDSHYVFSYMLLHLAFLPLEVFIVVVVIERLLEAQQKTAMLNKMNMVIGTFFTEIGTALLGEITAYMDDAENIKVHLAPRKGWSERDYKDALGFADSIEININPEKMNLNVLKDMLDSKKDLVLTLLANPNLLEHESFTGLLWAVFHLMEELDARKSLDDLPRADSAHITNDVKRVYIRLLKEWILYLKHLETRYPYMFSFVLRTHPLQDNPCATIED